MSWVARGLSRGEQGKEELASRDFIYAGQLFAGQGDIVKAKQLNEASQAIYDISFKSSPTDGNGLGSALLNGVLSTAQKLAPILIKARMPMTP